MTKRFRVRLPLYRWPFLILVAAYGLLFWWLENLQIRVIIGALTGLQVLAVALVAVATGSVILFLSDHHHRIRRRTRRSAVDLVLFLLPYCLVQTYLFQASPHPLWAVPAGAAALCIGALFWFFPKWVWPYWAAVLVVVAGFGMIMTTVLFSPVIFPQWAGTPFFLFAIAGFIAAAVGFLFSRPLAGGIVFVALAVLFFTGDLQHEPATRPATDTSEWGGSSQSAFETWLMGRNDRDVYDKLRRPYPVILTTAAGGGGFAAAHAYSFLQGMQERCPGFGQHVFAMVGISGGSLGTALFHSRLRATPDAANLTEPDPCASSGTADLSMFSKDHLSTLAAAMFFRDFPLRVWPFDDEGGSRTQAFVDSWVGIDPAFARLNEPYLTHFWPPTLDDDGRPVFDYPAFIPVATSVETGLSVVIDPFVFNDDTMYAEGEEVRPLVDLSLGAMVVASASFPYVTPSQVITNPFGHREVLVDGGYYDNSGAETVRQLFDTLSEGFSAENRGEQCGPIFVESALTPVTWSGCQTPFSLTVIAMESLAYPTDESENDDAVPEGSDGTDTAAPAEVEPELSQNFFLDPVLALINTSQVRGKAALDELYMYLCGCAHPEYPTIYDNILVHRIDPDAYNMPLGWTMPQAGLDLIATSTGLDGDRCLLHPGIAERYGVYDPEAVDKTEVPQEASWPHYENCAVGFELVNLLQAPSDEPDEEEGEGL